MSAKRFDRLLKNDLEDLHVCFRCGCVFLPMSVADPGAPDGWTDSECPICDRLRPSEPEVEAKK